MSEEEKTILCTVYQAKLAEQAEQYDGNLNCAVYKIAVISYHL